MLSFLGFYDLWCFIRCFLDDNNRTCYGCVVIDKSIKNIRLHNASWKRIRSWQDANSVQCLSIDWEIPFTPQRIILLSE